MKFDSSTLIDALVLDPLRARGLLSVGPSDKATPERLVALAVERLAQQAKEIERLREVNAKVLATVESAPGSGLRKRLKAAQEAQVAAEQRHDITLSYLHKGHELMDGYRADIKTLSAAIATAVKMSPDNNPAKTPSPPRWLRPSPPTRGPRCDPTRCPRRRLALTLARDWETYE